MFNLDDIKLQDLDDLQSVPEIEEINTNHIAVIGVSLKLPMANNKDVFWDNVRNGLDCIRQIPESRQRDVEAYLEYSGRNSSNITYPEGAYLERIDGFDYTFFHMSPKEASLMDPSQRLFLETVWTALEDAGYGGNKLEGTNTGVYVGYNADSEYKRIISEVEPSSLSIAMTGNIRPILASRVSYILDLKGPNMLIDTACSSSLVAVHLACQALIAGECEMAVAGGVKVNILPFNSENEEDIGTASSNGRTMAFDNNSDGTGGGEGVAAVLLKPLSKAIADRDNIYAVIRSSAVNNDGQSVGLTAPNTAAQEKVLVAAWEKAGIDPETISYIEAHGTGTKLGDPIEIEGIHRAFRRYTAKNQFCAIGALKTNIGHLDSAAGIAGFVKAVLAIKHQEIPPNIHFNIPNRKISFHKSPVYINNSLTKWESDIYPNRCGVSAFGLSGTNCHVVLEQPPECKLEIQSEEDKSRVLVLSAYSEEALTCLISSYRDFIKKNEEINLDDLCFTANTGRGNYSYKFAVVFSHREDLIEKLKSVLKEGLYGSRQQDVYYNKIRTVNDSQKLDGVCELTQKQLEELSVDVDKKISEFKTLPEVQENLIRDICELYVKGANPRWEELYKGSLRKRISLPTYPFQQKRCWIEALDNIAQDLLLKEQDIFYTMNWDQENRKENSARDQNKTILILAGETPKSREMIKCLREHNSNIIEAVEKDGFEKINDNRYTIGHSLEDYRRLFSEVKHLEISQVVHALTMDDMAEASSMEEIEHYGVNRALGLVYLVQGLLKNHARKRSEIIIVSRYVDRVTGREERFCPQNALLFGLGKVIKWENPQVKCRCIDIDDRTTAKDIVFELEEDRYRYRVAYRDNTRYIESFNKISKSSPQTDTLDIKSEGAYIITGGRGRIGLDIAGFIASRNKTNIVLVSRSDFPLRSEWDSILEHEAFTKTARIISKIVDIERLGSKVECFSLDVCDRNQMQNMLEDVRKRYGRINGIIHGAGVGVGLKGSTIEHEKEEIFRQVLSPKVKGTGLLYELTEHDNLDFYILISSLTTLVGGIGGGSYIAANSFMDSFAAYGAHHGKKVITINFPIWEDNEISEVITHHSEKKQMFKVMSAQRAVRAFHKAVGFNLHRVIIGELNYSSDVLMLGEHLPFSLSTELMNKLEKERSNHGNGFGTRYTKPGKSARLIGKAGESYTKTEQIVADIWKQVLGFNELNVNDNFFEIGGDSIRIIKMLPIFQEKFPGKVFVADFFGYPTIAKMAKYISETSNKDHNESEDVEKDSHVRQMGELIHKLKAGNISIEEAVNEYCCIEVKK